MRLPLTSPTALKPQQRQLYDDMRKGIEANFKGFTAIDDSGRLIGPWNPWLHFPQFGGPVWELVKALSSSPKLPRRVREIAILVTGAHFYSAYEIYAQPVWRRGNGRVHLPRRPLLHGLCNAEWIRCTSARDGHVTATRCNQIPAVVFNQPDCLVYLHAPIPSPAPPRRHCSKATNSITRTASPRCRARCARDQSPRPGAGPKTRAPTASTDRDGRRRT